MTTLPDAIVAIKAGRLHEGRVMLGQILAHDGTNVTALLWMTEVAATPEEVRRYLKRALAIDPANAAARRGLELLDKANEQPPLVITGQLPAIQPAPTPVPHMVPTRNARLAGEQETKGRETGFRWIIVLGIALWLILMIGAVALITRL